MTTTSFPTSADTFGGQPNDEKRTNQHCRATEAIEACLIAQKTGTIPIPLTSFVDLAGTQLTTFANGASDQPGLELTNSEALSIRWNNHAAPLGVMSQFVVPADADVTEDMTLKIKASKVGATVGDAVIFTIGAFNQATGALHDADATFGGDTDAMDGDATSKTVQQVTRTLATANLGAVGTNVTLTVTPKGGTLGTDDLCLHAVWVEYTRAMS